VGSELEISSHLFEGNHDFQQAHGLLGLVGLG
jgi:hypothetical protein